jgi:glyoxylase-like metal-dependent hydrolase (beta-lactamase superfamily II)
MFTVGPVQENAFLLRRDGSDRALLVDPGEEAPKLLGAIEALGVTLDAILLTHCHFDHTGAVAPVAKATGAPVYCPELEVPLLQDIMAYVPWPGFGPFESWDPEHTVAGGERLQLAGYDIDVLFTPGHSPGHVTYAIADEAEGAPVALFSGDRIAGSGGERTPTALFSGDVLFQSSIGRTDLPGGDHATLLASIATLLERFDDDAVVHPGHMGLTTLGAERAHNPFLAELSQR